ncbi:DUF1758 domain-containing protein [Trichonephila clavipes]|nr:DUF1758 domain-containing protein [Trichonephila clavipes]
MEEIKNEAIDKINYYIPHHSIYKPERRYKKRFRQRERVVDPYQREFQRIVWKTSADAPVKTYKLSNVTYGTVSAPFIATGTLKALADEEKAEFSDAADEICNDIYMDDVLSGESELEGV